MALGPVGTLASVGAPDLAPAGPAGLPAPGRCLVMGVLNVTPDSFSDGGRWLDPATAVARGRALVAAGADLVDVGGESTRPGAVRVAEADELARVLDVVAALSESGVVVSIDTMRASVAARALDTGAALVNDVSGGLADPAMLATLAERGCPVVLMHWRGHSTVMQQRAVYADVMAEVRAELAERVEAAVRAGVDPSRVAIDPGIGFAKTAEHSWTLLARFAELLDLGLPVLVGASRKSFLRSVLASRPRTGDGREAEPAELRDDASAAVTAVVAAAGAWCVRVHEVGASADAVRVAAALRAAGDGS